LYLYHIAHSTWPALYRKLAFDVVNDFEPTGPHQRCSDDARRQVKDGREGFQRAAALIKATGKQVTIGNAGVGSASHLWWPFLRGDPD
jgi:hypothetical protein